MGKPKRLSKVAGEFNLGINTVIDFLSGKGFEIESKPTAKITPEMYDVLVGEFQSDKTLKEKSVQIDIKKTKKETISIEEKPVARKEEIQKEPEEELIIKDNNVSSAPVVPVPAVPAVPEKIEDEVFKPEHSNVSSGPKVVGKIDLTPKEKKAIPKPEAKKEENKEEVKKTENKKEAPTKSAPEAAKVAPKVTEDKEAKSTEKVTSKDEVVVEKSIAKSENPKKEDIVIEKPPISDAPVVKTTKSNEPQLLSPEDDGLMRAKSAKLAGPKVIGKIELPVDRKKAAEEEKKRKRKRKRIKKEGTNPPPAAPSANTGGKTGASRPPYNRDRRSPASNRSTAKVELTDEQVQKQIRETLARLSGGNKKKSQSSKFRRQKRDSVAQRQLVEDELAGIEQKIIKVTEFLSASELSNLMEVSVNDIISACMSLGLFVSINQRLDAETISIVAEEFGFEVEFIDVDEQNVIEEVADNEADLITRAPIVTVMGHVDHGKTSLLDKIRKANVAEGEAGGITQHIGAYSVELNERMVTFLDTPGHEAFTAMRARGAKVTDLAIIIIAADDSLMPQTIEAINHAQAASVPMIFAINKIDKPGASPDKIREALSGMNILVEEWGGKYQCQEISAKQNIGIEDLLEKVLLEADMMNLRANPNREAKGAVIESSLDKGRGYVSTILIQNGTMRIGDIIVTGSYSGRVKAMFNDKGQKVTEALPSVPVQILGLNGAPQAGDILNVMETEKEARDIANKRMQLQREQGIRTQKHITLDEIGRRIAIGDFKELNLIIKGDVDGSIEALTDTLMKLSTEQIQVNVIHKSVGQISESDVLLASASDAIIIGFQVRPSPNARKIAEQEEIEIRLYSVIYDAIDEVKTAMEGMLATKIEEKIVANVEVREVFKITKVGTVAGCYVLDGKINRNNKIRIIRDGIVKYDGELGSLKRFKEDVKDVAASYECGLNIEKYNDLVVGDIIEAYEEIEVKQKLMSN